MFLEAHTRQAAALLENLKSLNFTGKIDENKKIYPENLDNEFKSKSLPIKSFSNYILTTINELCAENKKIDHISNQVDMDELYNQILELK